jgi:hypothetical protein
VPGPSVTDGLEIYKFVRRMHKWLARAAVVLTCCTQLYAAVHPPADHSAHADHGAATTRCWFKIVHPSNLTHLLLGESLLVR